MTDKLRIIGESGSEINPKKLGESMKRSDLEDNKQLLKIFDFYNTNKSSDGNEVLDKTEVEKMLEDLLEAVGEDNIFEPTEIKSYLESLNLGKDVSMGDFLGFINFAAANSDTNILSKDIKGLGTSSGFDEHLNNVRSDNIIAVLSMYEKKNGETLFSAIAGEIGTRGSKRENHMNIIRDKLVEHARFLGVDSSDFVSQFNAEIKTLDMTWGSDVDTTKLNEITNNFLKKLSKKEKIYAENKNGILNMMTDSKLCRTVADKQAIIDKIMKYSSLNNPKSMLQERLANTNNSAVKKNLQNLLNSDYLDYYPIFIASIIAQESQFRESEERVFSNNGKGVMQVTGYTVKSILKENISDTPYDTQFLERIQNKFDNPNVLYAAIQDREDSSMNLDVGTGILASKFNATLDLIGRNKYKSIKPNSPEVLLELVAMNYNGNDNDKRRDPKYKNALSPLKYVYARDVILRFKKYTPSNVKVNHFFEYNPLTQKMINN